MPKKYTREQFWKLYEKLPQELKDALFAKETGDNIYEICKRNGVESNLKEIVDYAGQVLTGVLPPEDFQKTLEEKLKIKKNTAKQLFLEINRFVFYPVKPALEQLYKIGGIQEEEIEKPIEKETEEKPTKIGGEDRYREPIE